MAADMHTLYIALYLSSQRGVPPTRMMTALSANEAAFLGTVLEGVFYGVFCVVFALYLNIPRHSSARRLRYPLWALFLLCTSFICLDFTQQFITLFRPAAGSSIGALNNATSVIYTFVDFIAQCVLIYRCWIIWDRNKLLLLIASLLAFTSFVTSMTVNVQLIILTGSNAPIPLWFYPLGLASFSISTGVNTLVTGFLVLKIVKTHQEIMKDAPFGSSHSLLPLIAILVESGVVIFFAQVIWTIFFGLHNTGFNVVSGPLTMVYGITPTIIVVRVTKGASVGMFGLKDTSMLSTVKFSTNFSPLSCSTAATVTAGRMPQNNESSTPVSQIKGETELYFGASGTAPQNQVFQNHWRAFERRV